MENYIEILENTGWINSSEIAELFTDELKSLIDNSDRPKPDEVFNAFKNLSPSDVRVLIIGQDPYPDERRAHGLAFSFRDGSINADDSLKNIFNKLKEELNIENINTNLEAWKKQGVLLLNTSLTLKIDKDKKEQEKIKKLHFKVWKKFINHIINKLIYIKAENNEPLVVMLWGRPANEISPFNYKSKIKCEEKYNNIRIFRSSHPSNLFQACKTKIFGGEVPSFFECKPFLECNSFLEKYGIAAINWQT